MKQKNLKLQWFAALAILLLLLFISFFLFISRKSVLVEDTTENAVAIETDTVRAQSNQPILSLYGYVLVPKALEISSDLQGVVESITVSPGQKVEKGELLISVDAADYTRVVLEQEAECKEVQAKINGEKRASQINKQALEQEKKLLRLSEKRLDRQKALAKNGVVAEMGMETSQREADLHRLEVTKRKALLAKHESEIEVLKARQEAAKIQLEQKRADLESTKIYAPSSGIVSDVNVVEGSRIEQKELIRMIPDGNYEVRAQIPARYTKQIKKTLEEQHPIQAKIVLDQDSVGISLNRLLPVVNDGQMSQQAVFEFDDISTSKLFAHKMPVYIRLSLPAVENSYSVSTTALYPNDIVYIVDTDSTLRGVEVEKKGYTYGENDQTMVIITTDESIDQQEVMLTHIPNPSTGLAVKKYSEIR